VPKELTVTFNNTGQHGLNCFDQSGGMFRGGDLDYVTMFTVNG
jgi:hypothetical protein